MPIYEYRCTRCGRTTEKIQKVDDPPPERCEVCSGPIEKLVSRTSFQLKGGGWFRSGYGSSGSAGTSQDKDTGTEKPKGDEPKSSKSDDVKTAAGSGGGGGCSSGGCGCH